MSLSKSLLSLLAAVITALVLALFFLLSFYKDAPVERAWELEATPGISAGAVSVRYTGTSTLLFSDGETTFMVDGWFSRPGHLKLLFGEIAPDLDGIGRGLAANGVETLDAVFPVHSHFDHAMDAPEVARRTGAMLLGSESTANIGRGWGLDEAQIRVVRDRVPVSLGSFVITPVVSQHFQFPDPAVRERALGNRDITEPLLPPVSAFDYRVGDAYVLHVAHPRGTFLIVGSAGYEVGGLAGFSADVVFLGVGGLGSQTAEYREAYWRETVDTVNPTRVIPIHYDSLTAPIRGPFRGPTLMESLLGGGVEQTLMFLQEKAASHPQLEFATLPRYAPVLLFDQRRP